MRTIEQSTLFGSPEIRVVCVPVEQSELFRLDVPPDLERERTLRKAHEEAGGGELLCKEVSPHSDEAIVMFADLNRMKENSAAEVERLLKARKRHKPARGIVRE